MHKFLCFLIMMLLSVQNVCAFKVYHYDKNGERVYRAITEEEIRRNKSIPKRSYIRVPRENWEITDAMRARKKPYFYKGKY